MTENTIKHWSRRSSDKLKQDAPQRGSIGIQLPSAEKDNKAVTSQSDQYLFDQNREIVSFLKNSPLFAHWPQKLIDQLIPISSFLDVMKGEKILVEGEENNKVYFLLRGIVSVYSGGEIIIDLKRRGDIFGEMSVISQSAPSTTVIAKTRVKVFSISAKHIGDYTNVTNDDLNNTMYRLFSMVMSDKLALTTFKARQYEKTQKRLQLEIIERKAAESVLRDSEENLRSILVSLDDILLTLDSKGRSIYAYQPSDQPRLFDQNNFQGKHYSEILPSGLVTKLEGAISILKNVSEHQHFDYSLEVDGQKYWFDARISKRMDYKGHFDGVTFVSRNISQRKEIEIELRKAKTAADAANRAKSEFLANMSHELRTPLNSILGFSNILQKKLEPLLDDKQRHHMSILKDSGTHLLEMVDDILDLSKIEAGKTISKFESFDFGAMLRRSTEIIKAIDPTKRHRLRINIEPGLGWIVGDEKQLKQVFFNLYSNAVKFTGTEKTIGIEATAEKSEIIVIVWDEGSGIPPDHLNKIFEPFERVRDVDTITHRGTGLGLAITKSIVEQHGGTISVQSEVAKGSRFTVTLSGRVPHAEAAFVSNDNSEDRLSIDPGSIKILVTEDNPTNQELIQAALEKYQVDIATRGEEAIKMFQENQYDIILMDIQLPKMDGVDTMKAIRDIAQSPIPIIALTAFGMADDENKYLNAGFDYYISKPINFELLYQSIDNLLVMNGTET